MTEEAVVSTGSTSERRSPDEFDLWMEKLRARARSTKGPYFLTAPATPLFEVFLDAFGPKDKAGTPPTPAGQARQLHTCNTCRHFLQRYGGLVTVGAGGVVRPVFWDEDATGAYSEPEWALAREVTSAPILGVLVDAGVQWGQVHTGPWSHFGLETMCRWQDRSREPHQEASQRREDFGMIKRALAEFPLELVRKAEAILKTEALYRSEKVMGPATWLAALHGELVGVKNQRNRDNIIWLAAATAPAGFAHVRSTMIGTLLEDLEKGLPFADVAARFAAKMHPEKYARPTAPPSEGNIEEAEKVFQKMGTAAALQRRFARMEDIQTVWKPRDVDPPTPVDGGLFQHLRTRGHPNVPEELGTPPREITWKKFADEVLPSAERIEYQIPAGRRLLLAAMTTATDPAAPPIIQWDHPERRNPVTWYVYARGSAPTDWNLPASGWHQVSAIALQPNQWDPKRPMPHHGAGVMLILNGCRDQLYHLGNGLGLFPEDLKSEYHEVRATVEAYSRSAVLSGKDEATACGLLMNGKSWGAVVRVTSNGLKTEYRLDRWD